MTPQTPPPLWRTVAVLGLYYTLSASVILILKWALSGAGGFPFPLTILLVSNTITTGWAVAVTRHPHFRPEPLTRAQLKNYVIPIGLCTAMEIGFSNIALKLLTVSFGTILKGASPVFVMLWGLLFGVEVFTFPLFCSLVVISAGVGMAAAGEVDFALVGFLLQLSATALGGFRLALTHVLLHGGGAAPMPPLTATLYTAPATALFVLPFAAAFEGRHLATYVATTDPADVARIGGVLALVASFVFLLLISEYSLVRDTSSLALSVAAVFKELLTIGGAVLFFHDSLSTLNVAGFLLCHVGIAYYVYLRPASAAVAARPGRRAAARPAQWERPAGRAGRHSALALPPATSPAAPQRRCSFPVAGSAAGRAWRAHPLAPVISVVASCRPHAATASSLPPLGPSSSLSLLFFFLLACLSGPLRRLPLCFLWLTRPCRMQ